MSFGAYRTEGVSRSLTAVPVSRDLDPSVARSIANGDRNPITKELIVDPWPEFMPQPVKTPIKVSRLLSRKSTT